MTNVIPGVVQDGKVIPTTPLPEGLNVQILLPEGIDMEEAASGAELAAWRAANAKALQRFEARLDSTLGPS